MTPLSKLINQEIRANGPMPVSQYMELCLGHPEFGYYTTRNPIGASGDFTTSPEISQMFGEMIGVWLLQTWHCQGAPDQFALVELGPGRGTLMRDILRVVSRDQGFAKAMRICLVETSPSLRNTQSNQLKDCDISFHADVNSLPNLPLYLVANEFFDALPVQQFVKTDIGWQERLVDIAKDGLKFVLGKPTEDTALDRRYPHLSTGIIVERSIASEDIAKEIGKRICLDGGAALIIDYGDEVGVGDSFQAVKDHTSCDPLTNSGECDLTCHVQFQPLQKSAECAIQFCNQGVFLENLGITARAQALSEGLPDEALENLVASHRRLVHPDEMGALFKVLALRSPETPELDGFEK